MIKVKLANLYHINKITNNHNIGLGKAWLRYACNLKVKKLHATLKSTPSHKASSYFQQQCYSLMQQHAFLRITINTIPWHVSRETTY
jgi:hypothetical protein